MSSYSEEIKHLIKSAESVDDFCRLSSYYLRIYEEENEEGTRQSALCAFAAAYELAIEAEKRMRHYSSRDKKLVLGMYYKLIKGIKNEGGVDQQIKEDIEEKIRRYEAELAKKRRTGLITERRAGRISGYFKKRAFEGESVRR